LIPIPEAICNGLILRSAIFNAINATGLTFATFRRRKYYFPGDSDPTFFPPKSLTSRESDGNKQAKTPPTRKSSARPSNTSSYSRFPFYPRPSNNYRLSLDLSTAYPNDQLQLAYCIPYTYTQLTQFLASKQA